MFDNRDWTLAFGFPRSTGHSANAGKEQYEKEFATRTGYAPKQILSSIVSDCAALCAARAMGLDAIACLMHQGDKVGRWAAGTLKKKKMTVDVEPFTNGSGIVKLMHNVAKEYSYGTRFSQLMKCCSDEGCPQVKPQIDLNGTRVAAQHTLIKTNMRQSEEAQRNSCSKQW
jgi:hypothetical protein